MARLYSNGASIPTNESYPRLRASGHLSINTAATGTNYTAYANTPCFQLTISNDTGTPLDILQGGAGEPFKMLSATYITLYGLTNADQISVRRTDTSGTQVDVSARWER